MRFFPKVANCFTPMILTANVLFVVLFVTVAASAVNHELNLANEIERRSVFATTNPIRNETLEINIWFNLMFILDLDERRQILTTSGWLDLWWDDRRYSWNSSMYGGIDTVIVSNSKIWKPDIVVRNGVNNFNILGGDDQTMKLFSWGYIEWSPANIYETICEVDVRTFPFDSQTCFLNFSSWMYYDAEVRIVPFGQGVITRHYKANSEWSLTSMDWEEAFYNFSEGHITGFTVRFHLERHSTFYVLKLLVPTVLLSLLNAFVFIVPVESGEKVSISVTTMLSLTVFLSYIGDMTPNNSENLPVIVLFVTFHLSLGALSIIFNIITLNFHFKWKPKETENKINEVIEEINISTKENLDEVFKIENTHTMEPNPRNTNNNQNINKEITISPITKNKACCTNRLANIDRLFFVIFIIISVSITLLSVMLMIG